MRRPPPEFPVAAILEELTGEKFPHVGRNGRHAKCRCPFHGEDRTPSASISYLGWTCFTCGRSGDAIKLLREEEDLTYADAVTRAEEIVGTTGGGVRAAPGSGGSLLDI